jgi:pantoate--beta-alanine ligase
MRIIEKVSEMQQQADAWRREGKRIAFVPTMGYLHQGHLDLLRAARRLGDLTLMSIFVNPSQFGPGEDYQSYPRDLDRDIRLATEVGTDVAFVPLPEEVYPEGYQTHVEVTEVTRNLCGRSRPVFLRGVATVVTKLFHIVKPHAAVFGEKDFQQLVTIRRMVRDLNMDVDIVGHPIVRESDGLAMSSRNLYLNAEQRRIALRLNQSLQRAQVLVDAGERRAEALLAMVKDFLTGDDGVRIDYVQLCQPETLEDVSLIDGPALLALAAWVGPARLIDNCVLRPPS